MMPKQRPASLGTPAKERLNRWCMDWAHEDFKIYSVPGEKNLFNDFHSRGAAPDQPPFYTLQQHARYVEQKLNAMKRSVTGNPASEPLHEVQAQEEVPHVDAPVINRQCLVIVLQDPPEDQQLQKHDVNLAGKSLLPNIMPQDWPSVQTIAASQQRHLSRRTRRRMQRMETAVPDVSVYLNSEGKILIPLQDEQLRINIIAAAHQGKHGHCKEKQTCKLINKVFAWHGMRDQACEWVKRCLQCITLAGGHRIPRPMGHQLLAQKPMEVIAIDFMSIKSNKRGGFKHILIIVDQLTRICVLVPTKDQTAATAARILCDASDGSHFSQNRRS